MKKIAARILSAALAVLVLTSMLPVSAEGGTYPEIQGHWAQATMLRAVDDGYIVGGEKGLDPDGAINRAQMCAIINRVLGANLKADLTGKTDVSDISWYRGDMEKAANLKYLSCYSAAIMTAPLDRATSMIILGRAFSLTECAPDFSALGCFSDVSSLTGEAKNAAASLVSDGFVSGSFGKLMPYKRVTRAEFLTMLYNIKDACSIYGCGESSVELAGSDSAVIRSDELTSLKAGGSYDTVALAPENGNFVFSPASAKKLIIGTGNGKVSLGGSLENISVTGEGRAVSLSAGTTGKLAVSSPNTKVYIESGRVVDELIITQAAKSCNVTINGTVKKLTVSAAGCVITGSGRVESAAISAYDLRASVGYSGFGQTSVAFTAPETLPAGEKLTVKAQFNSAPYVSGCSIQWYADGKAAEPAVTDFELKSGAVAQCSPTVKYSINMADKMTVGLGLTYCQNGAFEYKYAEVEVALENYPSSHYIAEETTRVNGLITTYQYPSTVLYNTTVYSDASLKTKYGSVQKGVKVTCVSSVGFTSAQIRFSDGRTGWLAYNNISIPNGNYTRKTDYTAGDKALWVNGKKYASSTNYLVWVSLACQKVNVFVKGSNGWELSKVFSCASGASATPTPVGTYKISYKQDRWAYNTYWCGPITGFYNGYAFHSWLTTYGGGAYDHTMGRPVSHGCIRMEDAGAQYMHTLPMNTTVVVF